MALNAASTLVRFRSHLKLARLQHRAFCPFSISALLCRLSANLVQDLECPDLEGTHSTERAAYS